MRKSFIFTLLLLAGLFTLAGCSDFFPKGKDVRFTAASSNNMATRTAYSGDIQNGRERIDWTDSDVIRIYTSSSALVNGQGQRYSDYSLVDIQTSAEKSTAKLQTLDPNVRGLFWEDDDAAAAATFYGITPSTTPKSESNPLGGVFDNLTVSGAPDITWTADDAKHLLTGAPNMAGAYLVAKPAKLVNKKVALDFYPAYTAFDITLKSKEESVTLNSFEILSTSSDLAGTYSFDSNKLADGQTATDGFIQTQSEASGSQKRIVVTFPAGTVISPNDSVRFTVFALPQDLTNISVKVNFNDTKSRTLKLNKNNVPIVFPAFHKANIKGIALEDEQWNFFVDLGLEVLPWTVSSGDGGIGSYTIDFENSVSTTGFVFSSGEYANIGVDHNEDDWTNIFLVRNETALYITFTIHSPTGANWSVQSVDPNNYFIVEKMTDGVASDPVGTVDNKLITIRVRLNMAAIPAVRSSDYNMILHTFVTVGENVYNIDSETQNFDRYNTYATFIIPANN